MEHYFETLTKFFLQTLATLETNNNKRRDATLRREVCIALGESNQSWLALSLVSGGCGA